MASESYSHGFAVPDESPTRVGRRAADVMIDVLADAGVDLIFGLPGGAIAPLSDALLDHPEIRVITTRHESGAMFAAAAYARATGKIGVVLVTSGPGIFNAMTGLASAHCDGMPVLLLAGEVPRNVFGRRALQEGSSHHLDVVSSCRPITKMSAQVPSADLAPSMLKAAIAKALSGPRGPVLLTLPLDVMSAPIRAPRLAGGVSVAASFEGATVRALIDETAQALSKAKSPLIFVGSGARWGDGPAHVRALAEKLQCPVMTTPKAKGIFPESHPLSLGVFGYGGHPSTTKHLEQGVDVLLTVGSGLGDIATNGWSSLLTATTHFIQIDADATQIGRNYPVTHGIVGDASAIVEKLVERVPTRARLARRLGITQFTDPSRDEHGPEGRITPMRALWELQRSVPDNTMFTCDIGEHLLFAIHYLRAEDRDSFMVMTGLGSMGSSIAGAIGARLGRPDRPVVAVCGDGCFSMNLGDLAVAARDNIPLIVAVLNDHRYGMVEIGHEAVYGRKALYPAGPSDVALMARSVGARAITIDRNHQIPNHDYANLGNVPLVLDIQIDRQVKMPKNGRNESMKTTVPQTQRTLN
jgi:acetolactate synthase-1/2/3 large subunit